MNSVISLVGGKHYLVKDLLKFIPPHTLYCEPFGGSASLLFAKSPSKVEVYNNLHSGLYTLFKVLREHPEQLQTKLEMTPYSREEYYACKDYATEKNEIEKARKFFVQIRQSFSAKENAGWGYVVTDNRNKHPHKFITSVAQIAKFAKRLQAVYIENLDFEDCIKRYDTLTTFFYCDPPYLQETRRSGKLYKYEMNRDDHEKFLHVITHIKGSAIVSGYNSNLYDEFLAGWRKEVFSIPLAGQRRDQGEEKDYVQECLWISPTASRNLANLFLF